MRHQVPHLRCRLVLAQTLIDDLAQQIVIRPGQKFHLGDELGPHPMHAAQNERRSEAAGARWRNRVVITSDRRVAAWGALRANWIYLKVGARWGLGFRKGLERHYPDVR